MIIMSHDWLLSKDTKSLSVYFAALFILFTYSCMLLMVNSSIVMAHSLKEFLSNHNLQLKFLHMYVMWLSIWIEHC